MSEQEIQELLNTVQELTASVKELTEENARLRKKLDRMNELKKAGSYERASASGSTSTIRAVQ